jgi:3-phenylpropionate/cinnamic acid dioxygenase small subunit
MTKTTKMMNFQDGIKEICEGMTVVTYNPSNSRHGTSEVTVEKVGNKLVSVSGRRSFYLETGREKTEYTASIMFSSLAAYEEYQKQAKLISSVRDYLRNCQLTYEQAQKVVEVLNLKF